MSFQKSEKRLTTEGTENTEENKQKKNLDVKSEERRQGMTADETQIPLVVFDFLRALHVLRGEGI
jgi:hypothetical protein